LKGYFETVAHLDPPIDRAPHSFFAPRFVREDKYFDERGERLDGPRGDVGDYVLWSFGAIAERALLALEGQFAVPPGSPRIGHGAQLSVGYERPWR
jgi:hypothetical protein